MCVHHSGWNEKKRICIEFIVSLLLPFMFRVSNRKMRKFTPQFEGFFSILIYLCKILEGIVVYSISCDNLMCIPIRGRKISINNLTVCANCVLVLAGVSIQHRYYDSLSSWMAEGFSFIPCDNSGFSCRK